MLHSLQLATPYGPASLALPYIPQIGAHLTFRGTQLIVAGIHHDLDMNVTYVVTELRR